jgi:transposase
MQVAPIVLLRRSLRMADLPKDVLDLIADLRREIEALKAENRELRRRLAEVERGQKRQAAPFSKGAPKTNPRRPGRKPGADYGDPSCRPRPERVDEVRDVPLPNDCPGCGGALDEWTVRDQFQTDIPPVQPRVVNYRVHVGVCRRCGRRVQGRHSEQTSDALGSAANQIGPRAIAVAAQLNKVYGLSYGKVSGVFAQLFGLHVAPSTMVRGLERLAFRAEPVYQGLCEEVRRSPVVYPDETGWKVAAVLGWLWVFVSKNAVVYAVRPSRGTDVVREILGADYKGTLGHDGWAPYDQLTAATHQTCLGHLLRRSHHLLEAATRGAVRFPRAVKNLLQHALALRNRRDAGLLSPHGLAVAIGKLEARTEELLECSPTYEPNRKFAAHLEAHRDQLYTFLKIPGLEATNWPAEQAIRPAVVNRKVSGGNRTWIGAATQGVLTSIFRTCSVRRCEPIEYLARVLRIPSGQALPALAPGGP